MNKWSYLNSKLINVIKRKNQDTKGVMRRRKSKDRQHSLVDIYHRQRLQYNHYQIKHTNYLITGDPSDDYCDVRLFGWLLDA